VGDWVIRRAAQDCEHWLNAGSAAVRIAVNVAPCQLRLPDFVDNFLKILASCSVAGAGLDIEITEGMLQEDLRRKSRNCGYSATPECVSPLTILAPGTPP
jgi:EAL domain-containing protein (putative c-di-GMP-specific phosphodiesterase class I)